MRFLFPRSLAARIVVPNSVLILLIVLGGSGLLASREAKRIGVDVDASVAEKIKDVGEFWR